jgi:hypothetical protein
MRPFRVERGPNLSALEHGELLPEHEDLYRLARGRKASTSATNRAETIANTPATLTRIAAPITSESLPRIE